MLKRQRKGEKAIEASKRYYVTHKEERSQWYKEHREELCLKSKQYREANKERLHIQRKEYYQRNKEKILRDSKQYRDQHKEEISKTQHAYYKINKEQILQKNKEKYSQNIKFNINLLIEKGLLTDCIACGYSKNYFAAIDFHHIDVTEKEIEVSTLLKSSNQQRLLSEASKCVCMCANCHRLYHAGNKETIEKVERFIANNKVQLGYAQV